MLKNFPAKLLKHLLAFWQQHAGVHCLAGASRRLTIGPAVGFDGCALWHELNQKGVFSVSKNRGHDFPSGQCLLKLPGV
jgi:hypothetical protein